MTNKRPVDRAPPGKRVNALTTEPVEDRPWSEVGVLASHLHDAGLDLGRHLVRAAVRPGGLVDESREARVGVLSEPGVHRLAAHPVALGHLDDVDTVEHFVHRLGPLLHDAELHEHKGLLRVCRRSLTTAKEVEPASWWMLRRAKVSCRYRSQCRPGTGTAPGSVVQLPEPQCQA